MFRSKETFQITTAIVIKQIYASNILFQTRQILAKNKKLHRETEENISRILSKNAFIATTTKKKKLSNLTQLAITVFRGTL